MASSMKQLICIKKAFFLNLISLQEANSLKGAQKKLNVGSLFHYIIAQFPYPSVFLGNEGA